MDTADAHVVPLAAWLRQNRDRILAAWEGQTRTELEKDGLSARELRDHLPELLERIAELAEESEPALGRRMPERIPDQHALERLNEGFALFEVSTEFARLRRVILELVSSDGVRLSDEDALFLHAVMDHAIVRSVSRFVEARERTLRALDAISATALEAGDFGAVLPGLARAFLETNAAADSVSIYLSEEDGLKLRASAGRGPGPQSAGPVPSVEAFAARVASQQRPLIARAEELTALDAELGPAPAGEHALRVVYGVPLMRTTRLVGVLLVGSGTAPDFSDEDRTVLHALSERATAILIQAQLAESEREARQSAEEALALVDRLLDAAAQREAALRASESRFQLALRGSSVVVFEQDAQLRYRWIYNPMFGLAPADMVGRTDAEVFDAGVAELEARKHRLLQTGESSSFEAALGVQGELRHFTVELEPLRDGEGPVTGVIGAATDITERKNALELMERAGEFRERILAVVSHDLKNPLQAIRMAATLLSRAEDLPARLSRSVARIQSSTDRMARLISDLLDYARTRFEEGSLPLQRHQVDLSDLVRHVVDEAELAWPGRSVAVRIRGVPTGNFDGDRVAQALMNLVTNALSHGAEEVPVEVDVEGRPDGTWLRVSNRGSTIPGELRARLFEPFARGERSSGTGLGLYIVRQIARAHGGDVAVDSSEGRTEFSLWLPSRTVNSSEHPL